MGSHCASTDCTSTALARPPHLFWQRAAAEMPSHPGVKRQNILSPRGSGLEGFGVLQRETVSCGVLEAYFLVYSKSHSNAWV
jgi:hypothetical protein